MRDLIVIGSGGFGREVLDVARDQKRKVLGVADDFPNDANLTLLARQEVQLLGTTSEVIAQIDPTEVEYVIGIGDGTARRRIDAQFTAAGFDAATLIHSSATLGFDVRISSGAILCAGVRVTTNVSIGRHTHLNLNTTVGHDCTLADYVTVNPGAAISGYVEIGEASLIGAKAFILQRASIGNNCTVGAGAAVLRAVPSSTTVVGVPARAINTA